MARNFGQEYSTYATLIYPIGPSLSSGSFYISGEGMISGIMVTAVGNTPVLYAYENSTGTTASGTAVVASFTPVAGTLYSFGNRPIAFKAGLYIGSTGSVGATIAYLKT